MWISCFAGSFHSYISSLYEFIYHISCEHVDLAHTHTVLWQVSLYRSRFESVTASPRGTRGGAILGSSGLTAEVKEKS